MSSRGATNVCNKRVQQTCATNVCNKRVQQMWASLCLTQNGQNATLKRRVAVNRNTEGEVTSLYMPQEASERVQLKSSFILLF